MLAGALLPLAALLLPASAPVSEGEADAADVRCVAAVVRTYAVMPADLVDEMRLVGMFYLGKLITRHDAATVRKLVYAARDTMDQASALTTARACTLDARDIVGIMVE